MPGYTSSEVDVRGVEWISGNTFILTLAGDGVSDRTHSGQFFMLRSWEGLSPLWSRPFSICDVREGALHFMVRTFGLGSRLLASKSIGERIGVTGPLGNSVDLKAGSGPYILVAGGIGIAPFPLLIRELRAKDPGCAITLIYGEKTASQLIDLTSLLPEPVDILITTDDGTYENGKMQTTVEVLGEYAASRDGGLIYACGPKPMLKAIGEHPGLEGFDLRFFMEELMACGFGTCMGCVAGYRNGDDVAYLRVCRDGPVFDGRKVIL